MGTAPGPTVSWSAVTMATPPANISILPGLNVQARVGLEQRTFTFGPDASICWFRLCEKIGSFPLLCLRRLGSDPDVPVQVKDRSNLIQAKNGAAAAPALTDGAAGTTRTIRVWKVFNEN